jgi:bacteriochlorophyll 4-vinyl reductase
MHQAITDVLPDRVEFYENWITPKGLREGTIGLAALSAVLSFLRLEEDGAYNRIAARAGEYAADWTVNDMPGLERRILATLPATFRTRGALRVARTLVTSTYPGSRAVMKVHRGTATVDLRGSLFCEVREASALPLCGFYVAAIMRVLKHFSLPADVRISACRAAGTRKGCALAIELQPGTPDAPDAPAAA